MGREHGIISRCRRRAAVAARRVVGPRFIRHYIGPMRRRNVPERPGAPPNPLTVELCDRYTIRPGYSPLLTRYHYNAVENAVLECLIGLELPESPHVLDIGSGAGHWIDFYRELFSAERVVGVELRSAVVQLLSESYATADGVTVVAADVSDPLPIEGDFDIVNAIGVMFHIVDDERWRRALHNAAARLRPGGILIAGGQFGPITHDVGFAYAGSPEGGRRVLKRLRSRSEWRRAGRSAGLKQERYVRARRSRHFDTPEANIMMFRRV
jgi:SAM-dependent methyltransferase